MSTDQPMNGLSTKKEFILTRLDHYRHGDVIVQRVAALPKGAAPATDRLSAKSVLAEGEVTGHAHRVVPAEGTKVSFWNAGEQRYFTIENGPATLKHEEHGPITLDPGTYESWIQRVYTPEAVRNVAD